MLKRFSSILLRQLMRSASRVFACAIAMLFGAAVFASSTAETPAAARGSDAFVTEAVEVNATPAARTVTMEVTAYCPCKKCCGKNARGVTASGKTIAYNNGVFVAADTRVLP